MGKGLSMCAISSTESSLITLGLGTDKLYVGKYPTAMSCALWWASASGRCFTDNRLHLDHTF